jgi:glycosyltransferase involved in cell wall biosynthesis
MKPNAIRRIVCFGPGPMFKGGISNYNTSLARALDALPNTEVHIVSWTQQYPAIIPRDFIDRKSTTSLLEGTDIRVHYITNYNNPLTWRETASLINNLQPDQVIFQWAIALQGLPLGWIARRLKKISAAEIIFDCHLVVQKEGSALDKRFTRYGLNVADTYVVHAMKTADELKALFPEKVFHLTDDGKRKGISLIKLYHPVYDMFRERDDFDVVKAKADMGLNTHVFLFFGFIRKYKGLHHVIEAFAEALKVRQDITLLIVGESFWNTLDTQKFSTRMKRTLFGFAKQIFLKQQDDEQDYNPLALIDTLGIQPYVKVYNDFVPNEDVYRYFQVSDNLMLYYLTATPSGVESIGYNFKMPVLATRVGHFPETVIDGYNGYLANPNDIQDMASVMLKSISHPIDRSHIAETAEKFSWLAYAQAILNKS